MKTNTNTEEKKQDTSKKEPLLDKKSNTSDAETTTSTTLKKGFFAKVFSCLSAPTGIDLDDPSIITHNVPCTPKSISSTTMPRTTKKSKR